jgi:hypothetical protein
VIDPFFVIYGNKDKRTPIWVSRDDEYECLKKAGFRNVSIVGMPIIYCSDKLYKRIPGSLLIMPPHTIPGQDLENRDIIQRYIEYIRPFLSKYSFVAASVHPADISNGLWLNDLKDLGIHIIEGAKNNDLNALERQRATLLQFESMTTSDWGSHVAYALYFGCKVSICGPNIKIKESSFLEDATWRNNQAFLSIYLSDEIQMNKNKYLHKFYTKPDNPISDIELGIYLVGDKNKLNANIILSKVDQLKYRLYIELLLFKIATKGGGFIVDFGKKVYGKIKYKWIKTNTYYLAELVSRLSTI